MSAKTRTSVTIQLSTVQLVVRVTILKVVSSVTVMRVSVQLVSPCHHLKVLVFNFQRIQRLYSDKKFKTITKVVCDADECQTETCPANSSCSNTVGSFECSCDAGWQAAGAFLAPLDLGHGC